MARAPPRREKAKACLESKRRIRKTHSSCPDLPPSLKLRRPSELVARRSFGGDGIRAPIELHKGIFEERWMAGSSPAMTEEGANIFCRRGTIVPRRLLLGQHRNTVLAKGSNVMNDTVIVKPGATDLAESVAGISWAAVAAGGIVSCALTLVLLVFGIGLGLSVVSPWSGAGVTATTFKIGTGLYLIVIAMLSSSIGGYIAGRLRSRWIGVHTDEIYFRDTAHGFVAWAFASILGAVLLATPASSLIGGSASTVGQGASAAASRSGPMDSYVDTLLRSDQPSAQGQGASGELAIRNGEVVHLELPPWRRVEGERSWLRFQSRRRADRPQSGRRRQARHGCRHANQSRYRCGAESHGATRVLAHRFAVARRLLRKSRGDRRWWPA